MELSHESTIFFLFPLFDQNLMKKGLPAECLLIFFVLYPVEWYLTKQLGCQADEPVGLIKTIHRERLLLSTVSCYSPNIHQWSLCYNDAREYSWHDIVLLINDALTCPGALLRSRSRTNHEQPCLFRYHTNDAQPCLGPRTMTHNPVQVPHQWRTV